MFTATLRCGTVLSYEAPHFRPDSGDLVPCRHHGYCAVHLSERLGFRRCQLLATPPPSDPERTAGVAARSVGDHGARPAAAWVHIAHAGNGRAGRPR